MKDEKKKQAASEEVKAEAKADSAKASDAGKTADEAEAKGCGRIYQKAGRNRRSSRTADS